MSNLYASKLASKRQKTARQKYKDNITLPFQTVICGDENKKKQR
jgi:hypothetical protein